MAGPENAGPPPVTAITINLPLVLTASGAEVARINAVEPAVHVALGALGAPTFPSGKLTITSGEAFDSRNSARAIASTATTPASGGVQGAVEK